MLAQAFRLTKNAQGSVSTLIFNFPAWEENFSQSIYKKMNEESNHRGGRSTMKNSFFSGKFEEGTSYAIVIIYSYKWPAQVGKPSDRIQKGQGPYVFFENMSKWREEAFRNVGQGRVYKSTTNL